MCQLGADQMGVEGHSYREILAFYYPGTALGLTARGLAWRRIGGENVALMTTQPDRDGAVLAAAERQVKEIAGQYGWTQPGGIEIRVYPDVETFRNATGRAGMGGRAHLGPADPLAAGGRPARARRARFHHPSRTAARLRGSAGGCRASRVVSRRPGGLSGASREEPARPMPADSDLRQREDAARARRAYAAAAQKVAALVQRYGAPAVLAWLKSGLPAGTN